MTTGDLIALRLTELKFFGRPLVPSITITMETRRDETAPSGWSVRTSSTEKDGKFTHYHTIMTDMWYCIKPRGAS